MSSELPSDNKAKLSAEAEVQQLLAELKQGQNRFRWNFFEAFQEFGQTAVRPLLEEFADERSPIRHLAANLLGATKDERVINPLIMALQTTDSQLRMWIIGGLTYFDRPEIREILLDLYQHDPDKAVQRYVAGKFGDQQSAWAVPTLIAALKNKDPDIRWEAAYNLGRIGDKRAVEPLIEVLEQDESSLVRDWAASSLGHLGDEQALIPLLTAYKASQNRSFVGRIIEALGQLSAGQLDTSSTLEILLEALKDENIAIQISAVRALGNLGDKRVIPTLLAVQPSPYAQDSEHLKIAVADAIEKIKNRQPS